MTNVSPISTSGASSAASMDKLNSNFDMFLTLLTTQLKNQDPLDPMDNAEMTNQLVQFANVEQQIAQNTNLEQMILLLNAQSAASSVNYIGKDVQFTDSTTTYDGRPITFGYTTEKIPETIELKVVDAAGKTVRTLEAERSDERKTLTWDGLDDDSNEVEAGRPYTFVTVAKDDKEKVLKVETDITGRATGAATDSTGNYILVGDLAVDVTKVVAVKEPAAS